jgi:MipA family protein
LSNQLQALTLTRLLIASVALLAAAPIAASQPEVPPASDKPDRLVMVGIGPRLAPSYPGSTKAEFGPFPVVNVWREDEPFPVETPDEGKSIKLAGSRDKAAAGLTIAFAPRRGRETATQGLRTVGFGMEAGVFAEGYVLPRLRLRGEARQGIGGHAALNGDLALDYVLRSADNERALVTFGPRVRFASAKYNRKFFGIDATEAAASGLPQYRAKGGLRALGVVAGAYYPLGERWGLAGSLGYDRLMNAAADSPLIRQRGSRDQLSAGLALTYVFRVER